MEKNEWGSSSSSEEIEKENDLSSTDSIDR
jgi:hypothetical protein